jgi:hypothetical protein
MYARFSFFALMLGFVLFTGCSKDNDIVNDPANLNGTWAVTGIQSDRAYDWNGDGYTETDIYSSYSSCQRDIILTFDYNGYGQSRQGCNAPWQSFTWQLSNNNTRLLIALPSDDLNLDLSTFNSNTIRGQDEVYVNGQRFLVTYTLSRR